MTMTTDFGKNTVERHPVAVVPTLEGACRTAISLMRGGIDGSSVAIRVEGLEVVERPQQRPTAGDLAKAATRAAAAGALVGAVAAVFTGGGLLTWIVAGALGALVAGVVLGAARYVLTGRRARRTAPLLGARRFVVHCDAADAERARRLVA